MLINFFKFALILLFYQSPLYSKSKTLNDFNSHHLSNYFSGIVAYENSDNSQALKFFKSSKSLIKQHDSYLENYVYTLVLEGKVQQATSEIKQNLTEGNSNFFEAHLVLALDNLKRKNYKRSKEHLQKSYEFINNDRLSLIIAETLKQYLYVFEKNKISKTKNKFGNFSFINEVFQRCYLKDKNTETYFKNLINSQNDADHSRYIFFYLNYLIENDRYDEVKNITNNVCKLQLEVSQTARDRLKALSDADGLSQSKYIEKLINYAKKNPKLISEDTKVQESYKTKQRTFDDSSNINAIREDLSTIDDKITRLLSALGE